MAEKYYLLFGPGCVPGKITDKKPVDMRHWKIWEEYFPSSECYCVSDDQAMLRRMQSDMAQEFRRQLFRRVFYEHLTPDDRRDYIRIMYFIEQNMHERILSLTSTGPLFLVLINQFPGRTAYIKPDGLEIVNGRSPHELCLPGVYAAMFPDLIDMMLTVEQLVFFLNFTRAFDDLGRLREKYAPKDPK